MTVIRVIDAADIARIAEIDRSERITQQYRQHGEFLELIDVDIDAPRWGEPGEAAIEQRIDEWTRLVELGGVPIGAFDRERFIGIAVYVGGSPDGPAQLAVLYVTKPWRRHGVGRDLLNEVVRFARAEGARRLYVSATPTRATVDFYTSQGFKPVGTPDARLFALEPDDIHMEYAL